ncbi:MAG: N-acetylornithine carbamoyltransferase [Planctomycetota bacterium]
MATSDFTGRDLLTGLDFSSEELEELVRLALALKAEPHDGPSRDALRGRVAALYFFNPSVRTRLSCESALARLGGTGVTMHAGKDTWAFEHQDGAVMDGATQEHVRELAPVVSRLAHVAGIRRSELITSGAQGATVTASYAELRRDEFLGAFQRFASVPVVNLESNAFHPLQGLADMATLTERAGGPAAARGQKYVLTWAWHPKSLPVATPHSQLLAAADLGMEVTLLRPEGWGLDPEVVAQVRARAEARGGSLAETDDQEAAYRGARFVCAKSWGSLDFYGRFDEEPAAKAELRTRWIVDEDKLARTDDAAFLHCLPVRRNVIVTDGVLDSCRSAVIDQAENRLWTAAAVFRALLGA